jgi:hypothetical protein
MMNTRTGAQGYGDRSALRSPRPDCFPVIRTYRYSTAASSIQKLFDVARIIDTFILGKYNSTYLLQLEVSQHL